MSLRHNRLVAVAAGAALLVGLSSVTAVASGLITTGKIKNDTVRSIDIHNGTIAQGDLNGTVRAKLNKVGAKGDQGIQGVQGDRGPQGAPGLDAHYSGPNWGIIDRNVIGNGDAYLRSGPGATPSGIGSLGLRTGGAADKATFGNEVDFKGDLVKNLAKVGFSVFNTGENMGAAGDNVPSITFEIDPNVAAVDSNYTSLVYMPAEDMSKAGQWKTYDATTEGFWGLTGGKFAGTKCDINGSRCTFAEVQAYLDDADGSDAVIGSVAVTKGRDYAFSGAVDNLVINDETFDFEPLGVVTK